MARLLPSLPDSEPTDRDPRVVDVDDDDAAELISALGSETARTVLATLHDEPATTSEIATELETSLQNAQYHLGRLSDADLVDVVDTVYSEKGREMNVYAPADEPLVLFAGPSEESGGIKTALTRLLGGYGILALAGVAAQRILSVADPSDDAADPYLTDADTDGGPGIAAEEPESEAESEPVEFVDGMAEGIDPAAEYAISLLEPGIVFFLGAALVFTAGWLYWYRRSERRW